MKRVASIAEVYPTAERTQAKKQELKHGRFAASVPSDFSPGYGSGRYPGRLAASAALERGGKLPPPLVDDYF